MLLSGGTPQASFKDLAHAWGREKGFHTVLANLVCERRGEMERKRRSDLGRMLSREDRATFKEKLDKGRNAAKVAREEQKENGVAATDDDDDWAEAANEAATEEVTNFYSSQEMENETEKLVSSTPTVASV